MRVRDWAAGAVGCIETRSKERSSGGSRHLQGAGIDLHQISDHGPTRFVRNYSAEEGVFGFQLAWTGTVSASYERAEELDHGNRDQLGWRVGWACPAAAAGAIRQCGRAVAERRVGPRSRRFRPWQAETARRWERAPRGVCGAASLPAGSGDCSASVAVLGSGRRCHRGHAAGGPGDKLVHQSQFGARVQRPGLVECGQQWLHSFIQ